MSWNKEDFREKLELEHQFPGLYMFKFIAPIDKKDEIESIFDQGEITRKTSKNNNYISITAKVQMPSSDEVIRIYERAYEIKGIIAL